MVSPCLLSSVATAFDAHDRDPLVSIIMGAGLSGMAAAIQMKRKMGFDDVLV